MPKPNAVIEAIKSRRTIRGYQPGPVSREQLEIIVDCGRLAPNALNEQVWEFTVVTEAEILRKLARLMPENGPFLADAPACIVVSGARDHRSVYLDGAAATENMLLAIHALGLGGCWIQAYETAYNGAVKELLDIPDNQTLVAIVSVGVPFDQVKTQPKRPLEEVLHWEKF